MRELSTQDLTEALRYKVKSSQCYSFTKITYIDDDGVERILDDVAYPVRISDAGEPPKYASVNQLPAAATVDFTVINKRGRYSTQNLESDLRDVLVRDRVVKIYDAKFLQDQIIDETVAANLSDAFLYYFKVATDGGLDLDIANAEGNYFQHFSDFFTGGEYTSDPPTYAPDGYIVYTFDRADAFAETFLQLNVTCNDTRGRIYYRRGNDIDEMTHSRTSAGWTYVGATANGTVSQTISIDRARYIQVAVLSDTGDWGSGFKVTAISLEVQAHLEWMLLGSFFLDDPEFTDNYIPQLSTIKVSGRNAWKRALENKINVPDLSGGTYLDDLVRLLADRGNIDYTADSIADLTAFGARTLTTGYGATVKISEVFEDVMVIIGRTYRMSVDENNVLYVQPRNQSYIADFVANYRRYVKATHGEIGDKKAQRVTVYNRKLSLDPEVLLASQDITAPGTYVLSWSGKTLANRFEISNNSGGDEATVDSIEFDIGGTSTATLVVSGDNPVDVTLVIYGSRFADDSPEYLGEAANAENMRHRNGLSFEIENPLLISDAEAKRVAEDISSEFGNRIYDITVEYGLLDPMPEINDIGLVVSESLFIDTIFELIGIEYKLQSEVDKKVVFKMRDTGRRISDVAEMIYDHTFFDHAKLHLQFDKGLIFDSSFRIGITAREIDEQHSSKYYYNVGEA